MTRTDRLVLFTDGLIETRETNLDEGLRHLVTAAQAAERTLGLLLDQILATMRPTDADDVTLLAVAFAVQGLDND